MGWSSFPVRLATNAEIPSDHIGVQFVPGGDKPNQFKLQSRPLQ